MTYTVTIEFLVVVIGLIAVILPGVYWTGRLAHRVDTVEATARETNTRVDALYHAINALRKEVVSEIRRHPVIRCPMHATDGCALGSGPRDVSEEE